jgi:endonuclease-3
MYKSKINKIFERLAQLDPAPKTELNYTNEFTLLVAIILSAQATDIGVNKATVSLFAIVKTPQDILQLGLEELKSYIKTIGLYNSKAKNIIAMSQLLIDKYHGAVPKEFDQLIELPGVGRKTANVFLNCMHGEERIAVDTHVLRVSNRIGFAHTYNPHVMEKALQAAIPKKWMRYAHHWLILHGRYICTARKPHCPECPIQDLCEFQNKSTAI